MIPGFFEMAAGSGLSGSSSASSAANPYASSSSPKNFYLGRQGLSIWQTGLIAAAVVGAIWLLRK